MESQTIKQPKKVVKSSGFPAPLYKVNQPVIYDGNRFEIVDVKQSRYGHTYKLGGRIGYVPEALLTKAK